MLNFWIESYFTIYIAFSVIHTICILSPEYRPEVINSGFKDFSIVIVIIPIILFIKSFSSLSGFDKLLFISTTSLFIADGFLRKKK